VHLTGDPLALALDGQRSQPAAEKRRGSAVASPMEPTRISP
jgi:hypothetical protein